MVFQFLSFVHPCYTISINPSVGGLINSRDFMNFS